jgi:uncharacterized protein
LTRDHPNALAYRRAADAFRARDFGTLRSVIAEDVVWHVPGNHPRAGDIHGLDELVLWMRSLGDLGFWLREHDVIGNDEHVCALSVMGADRDGIHAETRVVSVFHFKDGRQQERWFYPEDLDAWDRIFS